MADKASPERGRTTALVLSGGVALGAFQAGAYEALRAAGGPEPDWIAAASIGAVNAALIAGNPSERRVERLREFWAAATVAPALPSWGAPAHGLLREGQNIASVLRTMILGRSGFFFPRLLPSAGQRPGLYDLAPLGERLKGFMDFDRLNGGETRVSLAATDVVSGERVVFDTGQGARLGPEHVLASSALLPAFAPVEVEGRLLGDGGLSGNTPVDVVLDEPGGDLLCFVLDLFARQGSRPRTLAAAANRAVDLIFGNQTWLALEGHRRERELRDATGRLAARLPLELRDGPEVGRLLEDVPAGATTVLYLACRAALDEAGLLKVFDYSEATVGERWRAGRAHMEAALRALAALPDGAGAAGFSVHEIEP